MTTEFPGASRRLSAAHLKALAHPLRYRMLELLNSEGPATASALGRRIDESSGTTSYHLRQLAEAGFIEEDRERGTGRDRYWRSAGGWTLETDLLDDPATRAAAGIVLDEALAVRIDRHRRFNEQRDRWPRQWRDASMVAERRMALTPDEANALARELAAVADRYHDLHDRDDPPPGTAQVVVQTDVIPETLAPGVDEAGM